MIWGNSIQTMLSVGLVALGGCTFCWDPVNSEPLAQIHKETTGPHHNLEWVTFSAARSDDPNGLRTELIAVWRAMVCEDADGTVCPLDAEFEVEDGTIFDDFSFAIPKTAEKNPILVTLQVRDRRGAFTDDYVLLEVTNRAPGLELQVQGYQVGASYPIGTAMQIYAIPSDLDGDEVALAWRFYSPDESVPAAVRFEPIGDGSAYELEPDVPGLWTVEVTADDGDGGVTTEQIPIVVAEDAPPCIAATDPNAVVDGSYVIDVDDDPRRFAVLSVTDDLDVYPPPPSQAEFLGTAGFRWFIATPDTAGEFVEMVGHQVADYFIDPTGYGPGDQVELRVEIADRVDRTIPCDQAQPTCSVTGDASCLQRVTWEVEIR